MEESVFPIIGGESRLPVYLVGVGRMARQSSIFRPSGFPVSQVLLCTRGCGRLLLEGREHRVARGQGFLLYPEVPHEYYPLEEPWETHWVTFTGEEVPRLLPALGLGRSRAFFLRDLFGLDAQWRDLLTEAGSRENIAAEPTVEKDRWMSRVYAAVSYIDTHFDRPLSLAELAERAGVSQQYLCRLFRRYLNMRPFEYIAKRRIQQAKQLLLADGATVAGVAHRCGYGSVSYFCAVFRQYEQLTPHEFRSLHRQPRLPD